MGNYQDKIDERGRLRSKPVCMSRLNRLIGSFSGEIRADWEYSLHYDNGNNILPLQPQVLQNNIMHIHGLHIVLYLL